MAPKSPKRGDTAPRAPQAEAPSPNGRRIDSGPYRDEPATTTNASEIDLLETAAARGNFRTLGNAIRTAGLVGLMSERGPFTLFAPTDDAFLRIPEQERTALLGDKSALAKVLTYHLVRERVKAPRVGSPRTAQTVNGGTLTITVKDRGFKRRGFKVNDAKITRTEIMASNGVIHAIDSVLMPR
jgi:uncharacterized surface protein with fasciclin (FAS1) repeats